MDLPLDELSGSGDTKALHATVEKFAKESGRQTKQLIWLTWAIIGLTVALVFAVDVQIYLAVTSTP